MIFDRDLLRARVNLSFVFFCFCENLCFVLFCFFFSSRRRHTRCLSDWSSDVCSSDLPLGSSRQCTEETHASAPFGVNTPLLPSAGVSLFGALPRGSQRLLRIDLGAPLRPRIADRKSVV